MQDLYQEICAYLPHLVEEKKVQLYRDDAVSLSTLYHLRGNMQELLSSKVWLDSGANIIIESLETLTVIDVNSGKNRSRREEALFAINVEAAKEIARQLRLRNISGMILVDFINLKKKEQQEIIDAMEATQCTPSLSQAIRIKKLSEAGKLTESEAEGILGEIKQKEADRVVFKNEQLYRFFPSTYTSEQMRREILEILKSWRNSNWI